MEKKECRLTRDGRIAYVVFIVAGQCTDPGRQWRAARCRGPLELSTGARRDYLVIIRPVNRLLRMGSLFGLPGAEQTL